MFLVADNLHGLNPIVADAMNRLDPDPIERLARQFEHSGSQFIDINPGYLSKSREDRMTFLVEAVQRAVPLRLVLDSPDPRILARGLSVCRDKPLLNALSLEEGKLNGTLPMAVENKTELVILLMDECSFAPPTLDEKLALAIELRDRAVSAGMAADDLIFDPVLPNLSWDDAFFRIRESVRTVRLLASGALFQEPTRTIAGLSNLRSGMKGLYPAALELTCLDLLAGAGLTFALANALNPEIVERVREISRMT